MRRIIISAVGSFLLFSCCNCSERTVNEQPDYRIEELCESRCSKVMECVYEHFEGHVDFTDEAGCYQACVEDVVWDSSCAEANHRQLECFEPLECPEFADIWLTPINEGPCTAEVRAYGTCLSRES